jgi:hypothetical protein
MEGFVKVKKYHAALRNGDQEELRHIWTEVVRGYSDLSLTFQSDKLPALSGLAHRFQRLQPGARYLAELWNTSLREDLMWLNPRVIYSNHIDDQKPLSDSQVLSWSWAFINNPLVFPKSSYYFAANDEDRAVFFERIYYEIIRAHCPIATSDPTGQVLGDPLRS